MTEPLGVQVAPVIPPPPVLLPLLLVLPEEDVDADEDVVPPEPDDGMEHSLTDFDGIGSEPNVATEQEKLPLRILYTNFPDAPNATLVEPLTEQVCPILQMVT